MSYYVLVERDEYGLWWPQFGDYDKQVVLDEMQECFNPNVCKLLVTPTDSQVDIDKGVRLINIHMPMGMQWTLEELLVLTT